MAVARTSVSSFQSSAAGFTVAPGAGAAAGDFGLIGVETANQSMTTPTGWSVALAGTGFGVAAAAGASRLYVFYRQSITSTEASTGVVLADSGDHQCACMVTYSGVNATTPYVIGTIKEVSVATTSGDTNPANSTDVKNGDMLLMFMATDRDSNTVSTNGTVTWSNTSGSNSYIVNGSTATGAGGGLIVNEQLVTADATGGVGISPSITSSAYSSVVVVVKTTTGTVALTGQSVTSALGSVLAATALALSGGSLTGSQGSVAPQTAPALTSQSVTAAQGSASPSITIALTGQSISVGQGTVVGGQPITGQPVSVSQGLTTPNISIPLTGQSLSAALGSVAPATATPLFGQPLSAAQGSALPGISKALSGQSLIVGQGAVSVAATDVTVALTGQSLSVAQGGLTNSTALGLLGQSSGLSQGTLSAALNLSVTGQAINATGGSLTSSINLSLIGADLAAALGNVTVFSSDVTTALAGRGISVALGTITAIAINGPPQLQGILVGGANLVNEPTPLTAALGSISEPSGQIVNAPSPPAADLA